MYTVTICCSKKFLKEERTFSAALRKLGHTVFEPPLHVSQKWDEIDEADRIALAAGLTYRHFEKIRKADAIFVLNKDGYIGVSTNLEIGYAAALHKRIIFFEEDTDYPRKILAENVAKTPEELIKKLNEGKTADILE